MQIVSTPSIWGVWIGAAGDLMAAQVKLLIKLYFYSNSMRQFLFAHLNFRLNSYEYSNMALLPICS